MIYLHPLPFDGRETWLLKKQIRARVAQHGLHTVSPLELGAFASARPTIRRTLVPMGYG